MRSPLVILPAIIHLRKRRSQARSAFTLIELLVVIAIILTLTAVTIASFNFAIGADRVRSSARQFQSFLAGARDKAIYAKDIRGVRLLLDPNDNHSVTGVLAIGSPQQDTGSLNIDTADVTGRTVKMFNPNGRWKSLRNRGFLRVGGRIQIPAKTGSWFTICAVLSIGTGDPELLLDQPPTIPQPANPETLYIMELSAGILGDAQPVLFPRGVMIDLDGSAVPSSWRPASALSDSYAPQMDILYSPQGNIVGDCAGAGMVHLHFAEISDITKWHLNKTLVGRDKTTFSPASLPVVPGETSVSRDRVLTTLSARTGNVSVHQVRNVSPATTSSNFVLPASGSTVTVAVSTTSWMTVGNFVYVSDGTYNASLQISSVTDSTHVVLKNLGTTGNAAAGVTIAAGASVASSVAIDPFLYAETGQVANK